ncbi:MAG: hypothetical protein MJY44_01860 [Bacteroidales bacterium]|nr:hypothetical protein [Bacteroidales bacterium]
MKKLFSLVLCAAAVCSCFPSGPSEVSVNVGLSGSDNVKNLISMSVYYRVMPDESAPLMCDTLPGGQWSKTYKPQSAYLEFQVAIDTLPGFGALASASDSIYYKYSLAMAAPFGSSSLNGGDGFRTEPGVIDADSLYRKFAGLTDRLVFLAPLSGQAYFLVDTTRNIKPVGM